MGKITEKQEEAIEEIMVHFDFQKVYFFMRTFGWTWLGDESPSVESIKETARQLLEDLFTNGYDSIASGGLAARRHSGGELSLVFEAVSYCMDGI